MARAARPLDVNSPSDLVALGALLTLGWLGLVLRALAPPAPDLFGPQAPPVLLPDLAHDGAQRLALLPGVGPDRARRIVQARPHLGAPLTPDNLALLPGVGEETARAVQAFYAQHAAAARGNPP